MNTDFRAFKLNKYLPLKLTYQNKNSSSIYFIHNLKQVEISMSLKPENNPEAWYLRKEIKE